MTSPTPAVAEYPAAERLAVVNVLHGHSVPDPYRWLEDANDERTVAWSAAQEKLFATRSATWPGRDGRTGALELWTRPPGTIEESPAVVTQQVSYTSADGIYAVANLRGGSEEGEAWHRAGMLGNKQKVYEDFHAALFTVFDSDSRVDPLHARKMCAALQHATSGNRPILIRAEPDVGHGARALSRAVTLSADTLAFSAMCTGLRLPTGPPEGRR